MEPISTYLPSWWPRLVWRVHPGEVFGFNAIDRCIGVTFGRQLFVGFVRTALGPPRKVTIKLGLEKPDDSWREAVSEAPHEGEVDVIFFDGSVTTDDSTCIDWGAVLFWRPYDEDGGHCLACRRWFKADDMVLPDVSGEWLHAACCGPERESYVKDVGSGEPLGPDDPIPTGIRWDSLPSFKPRAEAG